MQFGASIASRKLSEQLSSQITKTNQFSRRGVTHVSARLAMFEPVSHRNGTG